MSKLGIKRNLLFAFHSPAQKKKFLYIIIRNKSMVDHKT
jgi:hypothetical protein